MAAKPAAQPGHDIVVTVAVELIGVSLMTLLAGTSDQMGSIVIIVMVGFALAWTLANTGFLEKYLGKPQSLTK
jgi:hypothetical protein